jgi:hypothetical protein
MSMARGVGGQSPSNVAHYLSGIDFVVDGQLTYRDEGSSPPVRLSQLHVRAENIRNVDAREGGYPSPLRMEGVLFDSGD